jgi:hypothetical protein
LKVSAESSNTPKSDVQKLREDVQATNLGGRGGNRHRL